MKKVTIILPTYNERENIRKLIPNIFKIFEENRIHGNIIVVDDNSPDKTNEIVKELQKKYPIILIERTRRMGIGSAYITGFKRAINDESDIVFEMDADLSHEPKYIPYFMKKMDQGFDMVIGSRREEGGGVIGWSWYRKLISRGANLIGEYIAGVNGVKDLTSGFRAIKREVISEIISERIESEGYAFQLEILGKVLKRGFKVGSIPFIFHDRCFGKSKLLRKDIRNFFLIALKFRLGLIK